MYAIANRVHGIFAGNVECRYSEGENVMRFPDHRSQMMAFCGHDAFCAEFNGERALAAAKENVERHYAVVGVIEEVNKTLEVMQAFMPDVFAGNIYSISGKESHKGHSYIMSASF